MLRPCFVSPVFARPLSTPPFTAPRPAPTGPQHAPPRTRRQPLPTATIAAPSDSQAPSAPPPEPPAAAKVAAPDPGVVHEIRTPEQFDRVLAASRDRDAVLVLDFMASWCRKCLYLLPRLRKLAVEFPSVYFCAVDVNKVKRLPQEYGIRAMPTFVFLRGGERADVLVGAEAAPKVAEGLKERLAKLADG